MRYRYLTTLLRDRTDAADAISEIYGKLGAVSRIRDNDQFWLQYAMSEFELGNIDRAEEYIKNALAIADRKGVDYSKHQIFDQRARIRFKKYSNPLVKLSSKAISESVEDLQKSFIDRDSLPIYALRSAPFIEDFLNERVDDLDLGDVKRFRSLFSKMNDALKLGSISKARKGEVKAIQASVDRCRIILANA